MHADQNPFRIQKIHALPYQWISQGDVPTLIQQMNQQASQGHRHLGIRGPHGSGKTTLMKMLRAQLLQDGWTCPWFRAASHESNLPAPPDPSADTKLSLEDLEPSGWQKVSRRPHYWYAPVLSHVGQFLKDRPSQEQTVLFLDSGECLQGAAWWRFRLQIRKYNLITTLHQEGRLPDLHVCPTDPELFLRCCRQLLEDSSLPARTVQQYFSKEVLEGVYHASGADMRQAFFRLYDRCAEMNIDG